MNITRARLKAQTLYTKTLSLTRDGLTSTSACALSPRSGDTRREAAADVERGDYRLNLPAGSALVLQAGEIVTVDNRRYRVVWAPQRGNLNLSDLYGLKEAR